IYYVAKGAFKYNRMEGGDDDEGESKGEPGASSAKEPGGLSARKSKRDWLDGVPHLKTIEQMFKEKAGKDGFSIVGEVKGADMLEWTYTGPFDELEAQQHPQGYPSEIAEVVQKRGWAPAVKPADAHRVIPWKDVGESEGTGIVHIAPGCGQEDF